MITNLVSDLSSAVMRRTTVTRLQADLSKAQAEASTGRIADRGLALGANSRMLVDLNQQVQHIDNIKTMNATVSARLDVTQNSLGSMSSIVTNMVNILVQAKTSGGDMGLVQKSAQDALASLNDKLNTSFNGQYLFAGVNTDVRPVSVNPNDAGATGRAAVDASFMTAFGMSSTDPSVVNIDPTAMSNYLDGSFSGLFDGAGWSSSFSSASDKTIRSRVSMTEVVDSSVTADSTAFRDVTKALTMVAQLGLGGMGATTSSAVIDKAISALTTGQQEFISIQAQIGSVQTRVSDATERLTIQSQSLAKTIGSMQDVDPAEVAIRFNSLSTQIQTAYALTSRIQQLSLLKYL
ncbi:MAG: flagellar hook-associated 3 family protein [Hyphomicrobiales bacterium]|nr:flagellar hook-associated 3 family protein [Hyphomicrobiales bacterium]